MAVQKGSIGMSKGKVISGIRDKSDLIGFKALTEDLPYASPEES